MCFFSRLFSSLHNIVHFAKEAKQNPRRVHKWEDISEFAMPTFRKFTTIYYKHLRNFTLKDNKENGP